MRLRSLLLSLCVLLWATSSIAAQPKSSDPILPGSEPIWSWLNSEAMTLQPDFDLFKDNLMQQIASLQANNQSLQETNARLQTSNQSLMLSAVALTKSLKTSQQAVETSQSDLKRLQKALDASMQSTIRAENDAKLLGVQVGWLKIGLYVAVPVAVVGAGYFTGHMLNWW